MADSELLLNESDFFVDIPEVTSASRFAQKLTDAPASTTIIDRAMIKASGLQTIPDLLRLVPGFSSYTVNSNQFSVAYHGVSDDYPDHLEVMIDGRSVYLPLLSTVDWTSLGISLDDIERIEVVRGSNTATQGSNAFLGSINIITREPTASSGTEISVLTGHGTLNTHASFAGNNDRISYRVSGSRESNNGASHLNNAYTTSGYETWHDDLTRHYLNLNTTWTPDLSNSLWFQVGVDKGKGQRGELDDLNANYGNRYYDSNFQHIRWDHILSDRLSLEVAAYHNYLKLDGNHIPDSMLDQLYNDDITAIVNGYGVDRNTLVSEFNQQNSFYYFDSIGATHTYDLNAQLDAALDDIHISVGGEYRYMNAKSPTLLQDGKVDETRTSLYGVFDYAFNPYWKFNSGARYEYSDSTLDALSYRNALVFKPDNVSSIRLGYSHSESIPSLLDQRSSVYTHVPAPVSTTSINRYFNSKLKTERIDSWELGFYRQLPMQGFFDLRIFEEHVRDGLASYFVEPGGDPDLRYMTPSNTAEWNNNGAEMQVKIQPTRNFWGVLSYAYVNTTDYMWYRGTKRNEPKYNDPDYSLTPEHTASLLLNWSPVTNVDLSLTQYYVSKVSWLEADENEAYNRTDLRAAKQWQLQGGDNIELAVIVQNAFTPEYREFYEHNFFDRRTYLQCTLKFH